MNVMNVLSKGATTMKKVIAASSLSLVLALGVTVPQAVAAPPGPTVVDVAVMVNTSGPFAGQFDTLIASVVATPSVLMTLSGNGQFTVFAPTDDAFAALGLDETNVGNLDPDFLRDVLLYHVAPGRRSAEDVTDSTRIRTLYRGFLSQNAGVLTDNLDRDANIIATDVFAANGVIHAIDAVVLPYAP
jgi:uncharacterized surface protein with fasciclin (FAS1) repeats